MPAISDPDVIAGDPRFALVRARDRSADGQFVYAVATTGVFCRPSCPARPARPENMVFYDTPAEALAAGFRPCKRCVPTQAGRMDGIVERIHAVAVHIAAHVDEPLTLDRLGRIAAMSPFHLQRSFKAVMGISPREYHAARRLEALKSGLRAGASVLHATFDAGYGSTSRLYEQVDGGLGMTPSAYRAGGAGESIVHAVRHTALGPLMMAATQRGVCFVQFGADAASLLKQLAAEFPSAELKAARVDGNRALDDWMEALDAHLARGEPRPELPLDLRGTAFQIRVWRFLLGVRSGEVVSYAEIARGIGAPRAIRAAASACGVNRIAVLIPCHRALRSDGGLGGYRWGLERKRSLLDIERRQAEAEAAS
ncbi:bifunctional DNA-binding transcriptional regulator/O6-methylguanine-DNA methyltransferase Ada [Acidiphilium sp. JA12-A1]|uniref:bifunctional DNA-binding transcriptional regulator/O6-methylguanine-DNA methyltransferase Ada n=1 Tax=Acidiphilium sp. JA12-A1 TaxID=1464546 RepID=UPI000460DDF0|nr:bifunctional DNA-binding transcriptional regulator/O6-methylguanine-DNA methyltransferase Ada [Acidiphilium sp. JA12-A1]KDM68769.1 bifunctional transcriptional activator/DNA repair enzyme Ada [Acidiphilium sp. JA12-A1]